MDTYLFTDGSLRDPTPDKVSDPTKLEASLFDVDQGLLERAATVAKIGLGAAHVEGGRVDDVSIFRGRGDAVEFHVSVKGARGDQTVTVDGRGVARLD
jgi:hypothetical protein